MAVAVQYLEGENEQRSRNNPSRLIERAVQGYRMANEDVQKTLANLSRELQESKARLEEAQRVAHVGHWEWDLETDVIVW